MKLAAKTEPNEKKLTDIWEAGFRNVEVYTDDKVIKELNTGLLQAFAFNYVVHAPWDYIDKNVIDFAVQINAKLVNTHKIVENDVLADLVRYADECGVIITVENEAFPESHHLDDDGKPLRTLKSLDPIRSGGDFIRLQEQIPRVRLCVDVEHAMIRREYPTMINTCAAYLRHVHLCGYNGGKHHRPVYENMNLVREIAQVLKDCRYDGLIVCEHETEFHTFEIWNRTMRECAHLFGE